MSILRHLHIDDGNPWAISLPESQFPPEKKLIARKIWKYNFVWCYQFMIINCKFKAIQCAMRMWNVDGLACVWSIQKLTIHTRNTSPSTPSATVKLLNAFAIDKLCGSFFIHTGHHILSSDFNWRQNIVDRCATWSVCFIVMPLKHRAKHS